MILMNDFKAEPQELREAMLSAVSRVLDSGWYVLGREVEQFEHEWASICGVGHAVGVANGMDAIEIALRSMDIGPGDEVITTAMTAFATVLAIIRTGATPVLADIMPDTALLSLSSVRNCISPRTKAIVLVHLYGQVRCMDQWQAFCRDAGVFLIEDCAQAHIATWRGSVAGSFGDVGAYSFYPTKNLGAIGDGGAIVTANKDISERARQLRNYGQSVRYHHPYIGLNSRLDEIQAAILIEKLKWLTQFTCRRREIAVAYRAEIHNEIVHHLAVEEEADAHSFHLYVVICDDRDALMSHLKQRGVESFIHYPIPIHHQEPCLEARRDPDGLAYSERHAASCISLPCHPQMTDAEVIEVIASVNSFRV